MAEDEKKEKQLERQLVRVGVIARLSDTGVNWIQELTHEGVIESLPAEKGTGRVYDLFPTVTNLIKYYRTKADKRFSTKEFAEEKLRQLAAKRELDEIKVQEARGEIHRTEDIEKVFEALLTRLRAGLLALPMGTAPLLRGKRNINEIAKIIDGRISRTLVELSNFDFNIFRENGGEEYAQGIERMENALREKQD